MHRSTVIGVLCGLWVFFGIAPDESVLKRTLTLDLYLFMASFLIFYRLLFKKIEKPNGDLDLHAMSVCFLGDFAWAVAAMFCSIPFFMFFSYSEGTDYSEQARAAINPRGLMKKYHIPVR